MTSNYRHERSGGGTCIFVHNQIQYRSIANITTDIEYTHVEARSSDFPHSVNIIFLYLPPNKIIDPKILFHIFNLPNIIIIGDFNANSPPLGRPSLGY